MRRFVLDASVFIQAHQAYYPFDVCPGFWKAMICQHEDKRVFSIDRIKKEIAVGDDRLKQWANENAPASFFKKTADHAVIKLFKELMEWVANEQQFTSAAKAEFADVADGWLVAYAKANDLVVVTQEIHRANVQGRVPIPNVCLQFSVEYVNTFDMLRELGIKLVLGRSG